MRQGRIPRRIAWRFCTYYIQELGVPGNPELAMGAIASGGVRVMNEDVIRRLGTSEEDIERIAAREREELERREEAYRGACPGVDVKDKTVILVDDGLATGATMRAAVSALRKSDPKRIIAAVPTAPPETCTEFENVADEISCLTTPRPFFGVGGSYRDFSQTSNEQVRALLHKADDFLS